MKEKAHNVNNELEFNGQFLKNIIRQGSSNILAIKNEGTYGT